MQCGAFILIVSILVSIDAGFAEPLLPEKITYQEASTQQVIPYRDGVLIESDHYDTDFVMYAEFDEKVTSNFKVEGIQLLFDVEQNTNGVLFLGLHEKKIRVVMENPKGERKSLPVPDEFHPRFLEDLKPGARPRLISTSNRAAAIVGDVIWWLGKEWKSRKLPNVPQFDEQINLGRLGHKFGTVHYLEGTTLYAGWNQGEWGGMLTAIDLSDPNAKWIHISGKLVGDNSGIPQNSPVHSIISPKKGEIWVATGLAHFGGSWRGLHYRDLNEKWRSLIDGDFEDDRGPIKLPILTSIQGVAFDHGGQIYILAGRAGILRLRENDIEHVVKHNFFSHSSARKDGDFAYTVGSYPMALGIAHNGDIFVSTNSFGVLAFRRTNESYAARQITLNKKDNRTLDLNKLPPSKSDQKGE